MLLKCLPVAGKSDFHGNGQAKNSGREWLRKLENDLRLVTQQRDILTKLFVVFARNTL